MWSIIITDLKKLVAMVEAELANAWNFLSSYVKEAFTEEEAALFPIIEAQATQLLTDVVKTQGLTVKERVAMAEAEIMADLATDGKVFVATLISAYVAVTAHKLGLIDGNQGNLVGGNTNAPTQS